jgi:biopolymer transport protein ExbD
MNMIPMMNLVTILIPFLLMASSFVPLAVVEVTARSEGGLEVADSGQTARVLVTPEQVAVEWQGRIVRQLDCDGGCRTYDSVPAAALGETLEGLGAEDGTALVVAVHADVPYDVVIAAMDASNSAGDGTMFSGVSLGSL